MRLKNKRRCVSEAAKRKQPSRRSETEIKCTIRHCRIRLAVADFVWLGLAIARTFATAMAFEAHDAAQRIRPQIVLMRAAQMLMRKITTRVIRGFVV